ncbi:Dimerisation domain-containing protein [Lentzea fradiae]|uniref:Dimerisation domain-containing protein n=1 Tax=Lentzea fradiae TaxID=200378 RepID=A0A1G7SFN9_9PSEU|nr:methyltransferase [Lentzea fradiae]SDG21732.1 Dimerisation domain-containing protein [Lentzea fradiae]
MISTRTPVLAAADAARLTAAMALIGAHDTDSALTAAMPSLTPEERAAVSRHATLDHVALLIFPETVTGLADELSSLGVEAGAMTPSVVVRERLSDRYSVPVADLRVGIVRAPVTARDGRTCELEIFVMVTPPSLAHIAEHERRHGRENHVALAVHRPDPVVLRGLRTMVTGTMRPDGGGYNQYADSTVLYFRDEHGADPAFRRLELVATGRFPQLQATHQRESCAGTSVLRLMTGAWATQAIATAAELCLFDHLAVASDLVSLAARTSTDPRSLARLLRYLASLGLVRESGGGHVLTELGELLRSDVTGSMRPLALMYGGPFYRSFAWLAEAVRTGEESYARAFGLHHFAHLAANSALAELFHGAMAASNAMFTGVTKAVDFSRARTVVDVAGGNGELLAHVLEATPSLRGVLLDLPNALVAARSRLAAFAGRVQLLPGDFTRSVPGDGDIYLLSRVLHDWEDDECRRILSTCARDMPAHAELLVVERLLPETGGTDSLAVPWDIHMLCNTGGRERSESHYRALLAEAGFELVETHALPLDAHVLRARLTRP